MKIRSLITVFISHSLTDLTNYKKKSIREKTKTFATTFMLILISFIIADYVNQTKNDFLTFVIAFPIILIFDFIITIIRSKKQ